LKGDEEKRADLRRFKNLVLVNGYTQIVGGPTRGDALLIIYLLRSKDTDTGMENTFCHNPKPTAIYTDCGKGIKIHSINRGMYGTEQLKVRCAFLQNEIILGFQVR
jgi:hypothetical protein